MGFIGASRGFPGLDRGGVGPHFGKGLGYPALVKHLAVDGVVGLESVLPLHHQPRQPQIDLGGAAIVGNAALLKNLSIQAQQPVGPLLLA